MEDSWCNTLCRDKRERDIQEQLTKLLTPADLSVQHPIDIVSDEVMLRDIRCATRNGLDLGMLYAIARVKWVKSVCEKCRGRSAIGNTIFDVRCISRRCEHLNWNARSAWKCNCLLPGTDNEQHAYGLYEPLVERDVIINATKVPPRRLWDLKSNRVVLFYGAVLKMCQWCLDNVKLSLGMMQSISWITDNPRMFEQDYWAISHSWVENPIPITPINSHQWPIPLPPEVSLSQIRRQALKLGATYIWLDVACLRQNRAAMEVVQKKEWAVDVPTIGNVYRNCSNIIRYFNGLGLPPDPAAEAWDDGRHWINRAWTLQEIRPEEHMINPFSQQTQGYGRWRASFPSVISLNTLILGSNPPKTIRQMLLPVSDLAFAAHSPNGCSILELVKHMSRRGASNDLDRVSGLNYLMWPRGYQLNLPIYDKELKIESGWLRCVGVMGKFLKLELLFVFPTTRDAWDPEVVPPRQIPPGLFISGKNSGVVCSWIPTWNQISKFNRDFWIGLPVRSFSAQVIPNHAHPMIVPTLLWGQNEAVGTFVFDDCLIVPNETRSTEFRVQLGHYHRPGQPADVEPHESYGFYSVDDTTSLRKGQYVILSLSMDQKLPWLVCRRRTDDYAREICSEQRFTAAAHEYTKYKRKLLLEKVTVLQTDERLEISKLLESPQPWSEKKYNAVFIL